jgi:hypothetical protein
MQRLCGGIVCAALVACGADEAPDGPHALYLGQVSGTDAVVAFVVDERDGVVNSYACGGATTYAELSRWFCGESTATGDGTWSFTKLEDTWVIDVLVDPARVEGELTALDGTVYEVAATRVPDGSRTDLFGGSDLGGCATGAIVIDDGSAADPRVQGTWCEEQDGARRYEQVTPLLPRDYSETHMQVSVEVDGVERQVILGRIRP